MNKFSYKLNLLSFFSLSFCLQAIAQKLPNTQKVSLYAPSNIKVDGKATEWAGKFQAYNHQTGIFYTLCNDNENIYLTVKGSDRTVVSNILHGGINLTIQKLVKAKNEKIVTVAYPIFEKNKEPFISLKRKGEIPLPPEMAPKVADSVMWSNNKQMAGKSKFIRVTGVSRIDTLISIYNQDGIKVKGLFDNTRSYTYELAFPIEYLGLGSAPVKFAYHITVGGGEGISNRGANEPIVPVSGTNADGSPMSQVSLAAWAASINGIRESTNAATDFWGEYILAKKQ